MFTPSIVHARLIELVTRNYGTYRGSLRLMLGQFEYVTGSVNRFLNLNPATVERLVFVCLGNVNRSPFAHALTREIGAHSTSFGLATSTGAPPIDKAVKTAKQFGIDLTDHRATDITDFKCEASDLYVTMEIRHARRLERLGFPADSITLLGHWATPHRLHIHDPDTLPMIYYQTCFAVIHSGVKNLLDYLKRTNSPCTSL